MSLWNLTRRSWLLSTAAALLLPKSASAKLRKHGGNPGVVVPAGVDFQAIDGGPTYYAGVSAGSGTNFAARSRTWNGRTYTTGWDDPAFFPIGLWTPPVNGAGDITRWNSIGLNTCIALAGGAAGQQTLFQTNGVSFIPLFQEMPSMLANYGTIDATSTEVVGILPFDEPQRYEQALQVAIAGNALATFTNCVVSPGILTINGTVTGGVAFWYGNSDTQVGFALPFLTGSNIVGSGTGISNSSVALIVGYGTGTGGGAGQTYSLINAVTISSFSISATTGSKGPFTVTPVTTAPFVGQSVSVRSQNANPQIILDGTITAYNSGTGSMTVNIATVTQGSGSDTTWSVWLNITTPETITQAAVPPMATSLQNLRFMMCNFPAALWFRFPGLTSTSGSISAPNVLSNTFLAPDGVTNRHVDASGTDYYAFPAAYSQTSGGGSDQLANIYDTSGGSVGTMTTGRVAKGTHYGNFVDYQRAIFPVGYSTPIDLFIDVSNSISGVAYDTQGIETNWAVWSAIIHGCRFICYFNHVDAVSPSGCNGFGGEDNFQCAYMGSPQSATFTGTISAGVLTTTGAVTGVIYPGMVSNAGISGQIIILQQTNNLNPLSRGIGTTFAIATLSGAGAVTGTITVQQTNIGMGGAGAAFSFTNKGMKDCVTQTTTLVRTMAPVINSPFATQTVAGSLGYVRSSSPALAYVFPSDTGKKNSFPPQSIAFGLAGSSGSLAANAIDCCAKLYSGASYTASTGDTISAGFYIFATTRFEETHAPGISVSFTINDPAATSITVIGESRNINITSGQGTSAVVFIDSFDFAWTCRIYRVNH